MQAAENVKAVISLSILHRNSRCRHLRAFVLLNNWAVCLGQHDPSIRRTNKNCHWSGNWWTYTGESTQSDVAGFQRTAAGNLFENSDANSTVWHPGAKCQIKSLFEKLWGRWLRTKSGWGSVELTLRIFTTTFSLLVTFMASKTSLYFPRPNLRTNW